MTPLVWTIEALTLSFGVVVWLVVDPSDSCYAPWGVVETGVLIESFPTLGSVDSDHDRGTDRHRYSKKALGGTSWPNGQR